MSGCSYGSQCPKCGAEMCCYSNYKPYDVVSGQCLECGFYYYTTETRMTLEEVNELRKEADFPLLEQLRQQTD